MEAFRIGPIQRLRGRFGGPGFELEAEMLELSSVNIDDVNLLNILILHNNLVVSLCSVAQMSP